MNIRLSFKLSLLAAVACTFLEVPLGRAADANRFEGETGPNHRRIKSSIVEEAKKGKKKAQPGDASTDQGNVNPPNVIQLASNGL